MSAPTFGGYLLTLLKQAKMSQAELSRKTGINTVTICKIISGKFRNGYLPEQETVEKLARAIPCSLNEYLLLYRMAGKVPQIVIDEFIGNEMFAVTCWEVVQKNKAARKD